MALRHHSTSLLDLSAQTSTNCAHPSFDPTSHTRWSHGSSPIVIGGNANVHLGDQHNNGVSQAGQPGWLTKGKEFGSLDAVSVAIQLLDFSAVLLSEKDPAGDSPCTSLHIRLACGTLESFQSRIWTLFQRLENIAGLGESILTEVLNECLDLAQNLRTTLDSMFDANTGTSYSSLRHVIATVHTDEFVTDMLTLKQNLGQRALLAFLILLRSDPNLSANNRRSSAQGIERILLHIVRKLQTEHMSIIHDLYRTTTSWFGSLWSDTKLAAERWLQTHTSLIADCSDTISQRLALERDRIIRLQILSGLVYTEMDRRYHAITKAQSRTLEWLFDPDDCSSLLTYNFARWLQNSDSPDGRIYWIRGKPGSGKSTLMRYLCDDPRTKRLAELWAGQSGLLVASCFFWGSGTTLQMSQQGLLQTLLHQMLTMFDNFTRNLFSSRWDLLELGSDFDHSWTTEELLDTIFRFVRFNCDSLKILILVDGLDEYQGSDSQRQEVCSLLKELAQCTNVKVCASSRPWNIYRDAFNDCPKLKLEQLTKQDISNFIEDNLEANKHYHQWSQLEPENAQRLLAAMVRKAAGVFLWVRLVVRSVLIGLRNGDDVHDLARRLRDIPGDLQDLFRQLLSRLEPFYLESASKTFELALRQSGSGHLVILYYLTHEHNGPASSTEATPMLNASDIVQRQEIQERRINAQCMGLLEFVPADEGRMRRFNTVEFLHRTARDFMASDEMYQKLSSWRRSPWDAELALLEARIRLLQTCNPEAPWMHISAQFGYLTSILRQLAETKHAHSNGIFQIIASGEGHFNSLIRAARNFNLWIEHGNYNSFFNLLDRDQTDFLGLAIQEGAIPYVLSRLPKLSGEDLQRRDGRPLLDFALNSRSAKRSGPSVALVASLLSLGASPNDIWDRATIWGRFLKHIRECGVAQEKSDNYVEVTRLLLSADASDEIYDEEGRRVEVPDYESIIKSAFPKTDANELILSSGGTAGYFLTQTMKVKSWLSF